MKIHKCSLMTLVFAILVIMPALIFAQADIDNDGDGYCESGCTDGSAPGDCDDTDPASFPGAVRICDGKDNNCDGRLDFSTDVDNDGDSYAKCEECDDNDPNVYPGAPEICDGKDSNCDYIKLDNETDWDQDGSLLCDPVPDCNDNDPDMNPNLPELCQDGKDNNCNSQVDESGCSCFDNDSDGYGAIFCGGNDCNDSNPNAYPGAPGLTDADGDGYDVAGLCGTPDCDDGDSTVHPGAPKICDAKDNDCDGIQDFYTDIDQDGDGHAWCASTECDDFNANRYVGNTEGPFDNPTCSDGIDNDCNNKTDILDPNCVDPCPDNDGDGYGTNGDIACPNGPAMDCNDNDATIYPGGPEICDGKDNNCNFQMDEGFDLDGDGYSICGADGVNGTTDDDCNDNNAAAFPGAAEVCDGVDNDCDGSLGPGENDSDGDGFAACNGDCDDTNAQIYTGAPELCDGLDNDCDGFLPAAETDADGDGVFVCGAPPDCDDNNASVLECSLSGLNVTCPSILYVGESGTCTASATTNGTLDYSWSTIGNLTPNENTANVYYITEGTKNVSVTASVTEYPSISLAQSASLDVQPFTVSVSCTNTNPNLGDTFTCDASSSAPSIIIDYIWSGGSGVSITPQQGSSNVTVTAAGTGLETISADLCTNTGYCQTASLDITINAPTLDAQIACPATIFKNQTDICTATATLSSGTFPVSYEWTSTGTVNGSGTTADVSFPSQGNHTVTFRAYLTDYPGIESTVTANVSVTGYSKPTITVDGPLDVLINSQHTFTAVVDSPSGPVDVTWDVNGTLYTGESITLDFTDIAVRNINVQARVQGSGTDPDALGAKLHRVIVHAPKITVYARGDRKALVGMPSGYEATVTLDDSPFYDQFMANLNGQWELHDGSTSTANPIDVTFQTAGTYTLIYRAWVTGYESYEKAATVNVRAEEYTFGPFHIHSYSRTEGIAPFYASVAAVGIITGTTATEAGVKYYWSFEGEPLVEGSNRSSHIYNTEGTHTINLSVTDKYGNESIDSVTVNIVPPPPLTLGMAAYYSNRAHTVPLTLAAYPRLSGGIRGDRLATYSWRINGADVLPPPFMIIKRIDTPGTYTVDFSGVMSISGETLSESFTFEAFEAVAGIGSGVSTRGTMIAITGNSKMLPDDDLNLTATMVQEGTVRADGVIQWTIPGGTVDGNSMTISGSQVPAEGVTVSVKGYLPEEPTKLYYNRIYVRRVLPAKPLVRILSAPRTAIVGQPLTFNAYAKPSSLNAGREIATEWLLPDGSTVSGESLNMTTTDADFVNNKLNVEFRAWLVGYKTESLNKILVSVTKNPYLWPGSFTMEYFPEELYAPTGVTLKVVPVSSTVPQYTLNRNITYTWNLPAGTSELLRRSNEMKVRVDNPGTYDFSVDLSDILGNTASVPLSLNVLERIAGIDLTVSYDKTQLIEPLKVSLRPRVINLQNDIVTSIAYHEPVTGQTAQGSMATMEFLEGNYVIEVTAYTQNGQTLTQMHDVTVGASTPPSCTIQYNISPSVKTVFMDSVCTDPDEKDGVMNYEWRVGPDIVSYSYRAYYTYDVSGPVTVDLTVTDKAGKTATVSQVIDIP